MIEISIVIPCYNEEEVIEDTLNKILNWVEKNDSNKYKLIIVNDGSIDNSLKIIEKFKKLNIGFSPIHILNTDHLGQQQATIKGINYIKSDYYLVIEADYPVKIDYLNEMLNYRKKYEIVQGSKNLKMSIIKNRSFTRNLLSKSLLIIFKFLFLVKITDPQIGYKLFSNKIALNVINNLNMKHDGMKMTEILVRSYTLGYKCKEIPIIYEENSYSKQVPTNFFKIFKLIKVVFFAFLALIKMYLNFLDEDRKGLIKYDPFRKNFLYKILR